MKLVYKILAGIVGIIVSILLVLVGRKTVGNMKRSKRVGKALEPKKTLKKVVKVKEENKKDEDKELSENDDLSDDELIAQAEIAQRGLNRELKVMKRNQKKNRNKRG